MPIGLHVPVYVSMPGHRKTVRLVALLRADANAVIGALVRLWCWAMTSADETGMIPNATAEELAVAACWPGRAEDWEAALVLAGYVERHDLGYVIHDWPETGGKVLREQRLERERWLARKGQRPTDQPRPRPPAQGGQPEVYSGGASTGTPPGAPPEARSKTRLASNDSSVGSTDRRAPSYPDWFAAWWTVYTQLSGRGRNKAGTLALAERLPVAEREALARLTAEHAARRDAASLAGQFVPAWPDPERYIKRRGWEDEYVGVPDGTEAPSAAPPDPTTLLIREQLAHGDDPRWREYDRAVVSGAVPVGWDDWLAQRSAS